MKKKIIIFFLIFAFIAYTQQEVFDKIELKNGKVYIGKVEKVKSDIVEFKDNETGLLYELAKSDIRYIQLTSGKILTFEDELKEEKKQDTTNSWQQPQTVEKDDGAPVGLIILATVGVVLLVLLLIGAAAQ